MTSDCHDAAVESRNDKWHCIVCGCECKLIVQLALPLEVADAH